MEFEHFNPLRTGIKSFGLALVSAAIGFFAAEFLSIVSLSIYAAISHRMPDFTVTYKFVGAPFAILTFIAVFAFMLVRELRKIPAGTE